MKCKEFLEKHYDKVKTALTDYQRWFDESDEQYDEMQTAINDLNNLE